MLAMITANSRAQSLSVANIEAQAGEDTELVVNLTGGTSMTALQFNLALPEGMSLSTGGVTLGAATNGHTLNVETLDNGDHLFVLYSMDQNPFKNGELLHIPVTMGTPATSSNGTLYTVRTATADAVSHTCADVSFSSISSYTLTYMVDGVEYKTASVKYGSTITPETAPTKEGYTFSGWSEIPATMPAHDVTVTGSFTINKYKLTYTVDGEKYKTYEVEYGATINPETAPTKEGSIFSGWSEIPATMPAHDVTVTGSFTKGDYKLTYMVDGEVYKTISYDYGSTITAETVPTKEGYTFSGWSEIPATMPAHDVTVTGSFSINSYNLTYMVDGAEYKTVSVKYGSAITAETAPTKEGYTFSGWSEIPETMPAHDVTVTGTFTKNVLGKCAPPTIAYKDGKLSFDCETEDVTFCYSVTPPSSLQGEGSGVTLSNKYTVSVYAKKDGYVNSETVTQEIEIGGLLGDVNGDGIVDISDYIGVANIILTGKP